jgi:hypothetical protein
MCFASILCVDGTRCEAQAPQWKVEMRIQELRGEFDKYLAAGRAGGGIDRRAEDHTNVRALNKIVSEERGRSPRSAGMYQLALRELGKYIDQYDAVQSLVDNLDEDFSHAPGFTQSPIEHFPAANVLVDTRSAKGRDQIIASVATPQSERLLHIKAFVLVRLDESDERPWEVSQAVSRLTREIEWLRTGRRTSDRAKIETQIDNLRRMIALMLQPNFQVAAIPPRRD